MKLEILFVAASMILVVGIVAIATPNQVYAPGPAKHEWCYVSASTGEHCSFATKGECKKAQAADGGLITSPCRRK